MEGDPVGEALSADADTFEDTVASELVKDQGGVDLAGSLVVVGDDATDKVGVGVTKGVHQLGELFLVQLGDGPVRDQQILALVHLINLYLKACSVSPKLNSNKLCKDKSNALAYHLLNLTISVE